MDEWTISGLYGQGRNQGCDLEPISALSKDEEKSAKPVTGRNLKPGLPEMVSTVWDILAQVSVPESPADALNLKG